MNDHRISDDIISLGLVELPLAEGVVTGVMGLLNRALGSDPTDSRKYRADYERRMGALRLEARRHGIDTDVVELRASQAASSAYERSHSIPLVEAASSPSKERLSRSVSESFWEAFRDMYDGISDQDISMAALGLLMAIFVNTFAHGLLVAASGGGPIGLLCANFVMSTFVAPVVEETIRRETLKHSKGALGAFTAAINTYEFAYYVTGSLAQGGSLAVIVPIRFIVALLHHTLSAIQRSGRARDLADGLPDHRAGEGGYRAAVLIHGLWNGTATLLHVLAVTAGR